MKKHLLTGLFLISFLNTQAQESSILHVLTGSQDIEAATLYYYERVSTEIDQLLLKNKVSVFRDEAMKEKISEEQFKKETRIQWIMQIINPETPDNPFNLIDTGIWMNQAVRSAESVLWKEKVLQVKTNNLEGTATYFLPLKDIEKQVKGRGYNLLKFYSLNFGEFNNSTIHTHCPAFLQLLSSKLYANPKITAYKESRLKLIIPNENLLKARTVTLGDEGNVQISYSPSNTDSINGILFSYLSETDDDEIELELVSLAPTYSMGQYAPYMPWYWCSEKNAEKIYTNQEWSALLAIQSYTIRKNIFPNFEYLENN